MKERLIGGVAEPTPAHGLGLGAKIGLVVVGLMPAGFAGVPTAGAQETSPAASTTALPEIAEHYGFGATAYCEDKEGIGPDGQPRTIPAGTVILEDHRGGNGDISYTEFSGKINGHVIPKGPSTFIESGTDFHFEYNSGNVPTLSPEGDIEAHFVADDNAGELVIDVGCKNAEQPVDEPVDEPDTPVDPVEPVEETSNEGYRLAAADGGVFNYGDSPFYGSGAETPGQRFVGTLETATGEGYIQVRADGNIIYHGDAKNYMFGSFDPEQLAGRQIVSVSMNRSGDGIFGVAADGSVFGLGNAEVLEDTDGISLKEPIVGIAADPSSEGYWLVASDGGIFAYNGARFHGSTGNIKLNKPVVGMRSTPTGEGYWLVASDGGIFTFGDAPFYGSTGGVRLNQPVVGMDSSSKTGVANESGGYFLVAADGGVFTYGNAQFRGSTASTPLNAPVIGINVIERLKLT